MKFDAGVFDVAVIGAGHAGIEAGLACARMGLHTAVFTINLDAVGNMPCNPAIGGTGKGHLVRELDALGGEMAKAADRCCIQYRMLNRGKGPAVHSLRAQADRRKYQEDMKRTLERQAGLELMQAMVTEIGLNAAGAVCSVTTSLGAVYRVRAAVIASGTYLDARVIIGESAVSSGPDGMQAAQGLTACLKGFGLRMRRFKTGTPPRVNRRSIDFSQMELQAGDDEPVPFSFRTETAPENRAVCHLTYTNEKTHEVIRKNFGRSPLFNGMIESVGPRYCPSIETKIDRFPDKPRHQLFIEPCGLGTDEMYIQGFSSSLPLDVQLEMLHGYIGTLIDDLVTKGTNEPYRIMTSRSEYRLLHRQDNADRRLSHIGHRIGLISDAEYQQVVDKYAAVEREIARLESTGIAESEALNAVLTAAGTAPVRGSARLADLVRRPQVGYDDLAAFDPERPALPKEQREAVEIEMKYAGYIARQEKQVEEFRKEESRLLPDDIDYLSISGLRVEARQKLAEIRPLSVGQAGRISGVSPSDIAVLLIWLAQREAEK